MALASNPAELPTNALRYLMCFPPWSTILFGALAPVAALVGMMSEVNVGGPAPAIPFIVLALAPAFGVSGYLREHFQHGCANPGIVVSEQQGLIAVFTDLTTTGHPYPAVKVLKQPLSRMAGRFTNGTRVSMVAVYYGHVTNPRWDDFDPIAANCVNGDPKELNRLLASFGEDDWHEMDIALQQVPKPFKPGLYMLDPAPFPPSAWG